MPSASVISASKVNPGDLSNCAKQNEDPSSDEKNIKMDLSVRLDSIKRRRNKQFLFEQTSIALLFLHENEHIKM